MRVPATRATNSARPYVVIGGRVVVENSRLVSGDMERSSPPPGARRAASWQRMVER